MQGAHPAQRVPAALLLAAVLLLRWLCRGLLLLLLGAHHILWVCMRLEGLCLWLQVEALQLSCCLQANSLRRQSRCSSQIGEVAGDHPALF